MTKPIRADLEVKVERKWVKGAEVKQNEGTFNTMKGIIKIIIMEG